MDVGEGPVEVLAGGGIPFVRFSDLANLMDSAAGPIAPIVDAIESGVWTIAWYGSRRVAGSTHCVMISATGSDGSAITVGVTSTNVARVVVQDSGGFSTYDFAADVDNTHAHSWIVGMAANGDCTLWYDGVAETVSQTLRSPATLDEVELGNYLPFTGGWGDVYDIQVFDQ